MRVSIALIMFGMAGWVIPATAGEPYEIRDFRAEEPQIYTREFKKVEVSAEVVLAPGAATPALNLVQVSEQGDRLRFLGILVFSPKKGRWTRKVELLQRDSGKLFFEIVPEAEMEPFKKLQRPRAVIEVLRRPTLFEILKGVFFRMFGASEFREPSSTRDCRTSLTGSEPNWEELSARDLPAGVRGVSGELQVEGKKAGAWAAITAVLQRNPSDVKSVLWEPANLKNLEKTRVQVDGVSEQAKQVRLEMKPVFFIKLNWEERWERQGDRIVYRKVSGDDRLRHFCGWMEVQAGPGDAKASRVTLYEEVDAPGRNAHDILAGHLGTIRRILKH